MQNFLNNENGQGLVEYGLIIALIAIVVLAALTLFGDTVGKSLNNSNAKLFGGN